MYLDPDIMNTSERMAVAQWLESNGCRHHIALEPIIIKGQWAFYTALCRKDAKSMRRAKIRDCEMVPLGRRRVRIRSPR